MARRGRLDYGHTCDDKADGSEKRNESGGELHGKFGLGVCELVWLVR